MPKSLTFVEKLNRFPPIVCRILARVPLDTGGVRAKTDHEIAQASGLTLSKVASLSHLTTWDEVPLATIVAFTKGCGSDLDNRDWQRHNAAYMRNLRSIPQYLRSSPDWKNRFEPLVKMWLEETDAASAA